MKIGLFQLENLLSIRNQFVFLDVRLKKEDWPAKLKNVLQPAVHVDQSRNYLLQQKIPPATPIMLIDEDGRRADSVARELEDAGYKQIYVVADGLAGLLSEL